MISRQESAPAGSVAGAESIGGGTDTQQDSGPRRRATKAEMAARYSVLTDLAFEHGPCSVRHLFYRAVVENIVTKDDSGYNKVQRALLALRRRHDIPYRLITDSTRWMSRAEVWPGPDSVLRHVAATYRRDLWHTSPYRVEVWVESDSIKGTIWNVADKWAVPVYTCRGQTSETLAYKAVDEWHYEPDPIRIILYIGDHDPAGLEIEKSLVDKLTRFNQDTVDFEFFRVAVTWEQVRHGDLPGSPPKKTYGYPLAVEAEALPPNQLRDLLDTEIESYVDHRELEILKVAEESERDIFLRLAGEVA